MSKRKNDLIPKDEGAPLGRECLEMMFDVGVYGGRAIW